MNTQNTYPGYGQEQLPMQGQGQVSDLFPEIYKVMQPAVQNALDMWMSQSPSPESLTNAHFDHLVYQTLHIAGLDDQYGEPAAAMAPPRRHYRHGYRPRFGPDDLAKILLLQEFFRRYGYYPPYAPYPYYY